MRIRASWQRLPRLSEAFSSRSNAVGFLRLFLACSVLVSHSWPLGLGKGNLGLNHTAGQTDVGQLAVYGFFVLSGFLITASGLRFSLPRFLWHRFLRIYPGLWVCLLVTALVIAPLVAIRENGNLAGFWSGHPDGPLHYLRSNWWAGIRQYTIDGLLGDTPWGRAGGGVGAFDGSLWTLIYEIVCYLVVAALAVTAVLRAAPRAVLLLAGLGYLFLLWDFAHGSGIATRPIGRGGIGPFPLIGGLDIQILVYLGFFFLVGAAIQLYKDRLPVHPAIAALALAAFVLSAHFGGFYVVGVLAYVYVLFYAACRLPSWLHGIGRRRDYSYGIYIYAFPIQMIAAMFNIQRFGVVVFILVSFVATAILAVLSWHLVEHPAMTLKDWSPRWPRRRRAEAGGTDSRSPAAAATTEPATTGVAAGATPFSPVDIPAQRQGERSPEPSQSTVDTELVSRPQ